jgi:hypothetical protein
MNLALITSHQLFQRIDAAYKALWPANDPHMSDLSPCLCPQCTQAFASSSGC